MAVSAPPHAALWRWCPLRDAQPPPRGPRKYCFLYSYFGLNQHPFLK